MALLVSAESGGPSTLDQRVPVRPEQHAWDTLGGSAAEATSAAGGSSGLVIARRRPGSRRRSGRDRTSAQQTAWPFQAGDHWFESSTARAMAHRELAALAELRKYRTQVLTRIEQMLAGRGVRDRERQIDLAGCTPDPSFHQGSQGHRVGRGLALNHRS